MGTLFRNPDHDRREILGCSLIFFHVILIGSIHPLRIKFPHPTVRKLRFPGHRDLTVKERIHFLHPFDCSEASQEIIRQKIFPLLRIFLFQRIILIVISLSIWFITMVLAPWLSISVLRHRNTDIPAARETMMTADFLLSFRI